MVLEAIIFSAYTLRHYLDQRNQGDCLSSSDERKERILKLIDVVFLLPLLVDGSLKALQVPLALSREYMLWSCEELLNV